MKNKAAPWNQERKETTTYFNNKRAQKNINNALAYMNDARRAQRLKANECRYCFYMRTDRIGGAAMTTQPCANCGEEQVYSSTNTDVLCDTCASETESCKHCGGAIDGCVCFG